MFAVTRFRLPTPDASFGEQLDPILAGWSDRPGFLGAEYGCSTDDPTLWALISRWADVGSYRRALTYDVKVAFYAIQGLVIDEPSAFTDPDIDLPRGT